MKTQPKPPKKTKPADELTKAIYNMTLQNNNMMKRLINNPTIERKLCVKLERILDYPERWEKLNEAERAEIIKEANHVKETLRQMRESRPLML